MVQVTGTVHDVSDNPDRVERIVVRAVEPRMHGTTYITEEAAQFPVVDGVLDFEVLPGPCVVAFLRYHGATTYEKLLVPDKTSAELVECIEAANLATEGTLSALERLALDLQAELGQVPSLVSDALAQDSTIIDAVKQINQAVRVDTTVGTRVFAGDQMIYGDTGRRALASWDAEGNITGNMPEGLIPSPGTDGYVVIRRENNLVTMYIRGGEASGRTVAVRDLPVGFSADGDTWELTFCRVGTHTDAKTAVVRLGASHATFRGIEPGDQFGGSQYHVVFRWSPADAWPPSLPGTPA